MRFFLIGLDALAILVHQADLELRDLVTFLGGQAIPRHGFGVIAVTVRPLACRGEGVQRTRHTPPQFWQPWERLAVRDQLAQRYGVNCQIKWPNDLLLNGKKIVGILCESVSYGFQMQGRGIVCGIGINLAQPQSYFDAANLPNGTSLELQGAKVDLAADPQWLAEALTEEANGRPVVPS